MGRKEGKKEEQGRTPFSHQACPLCIFKKRKNEKWGGPSSHQGLTLIFSKNWVGVPKVQYVLLGGCTATSEVQSTFWALGGQWAGSLSLTEVEEGNTTYLASSFCRPICSSRATQKGFPRMPPSFAFPDSKGISLFFSFPRYTTQHTMPPPPPVQPSNLPSLSPLSFQASYFSAPSPPSRYGFHPNVQTFDGCCLPHLFTN